MLLVDRQRTNYGANGHMSNMIRVFNSVRDLIDGQRVYRNRLAYNFGIVMQVSGKTETTLTGWVSHIFTVLQLNLLNCSSFLNYIVFRIRFCIFVYFC